MQTRIYVITNQDSKRLVEAGSASQAIRHCVTPLYGAKVAGAKEIAQLMREGVTVETALVDRPAPPVAGRPETESNADEPHEKQGEN